GMTSTGGRVSSPSRMIEPLPNWRSIWASALSSEEPRSFEADLLEDFGAAMGCSFLSAGRADVVTIAATLSADPDIRSPPPMPCGCRGPGEGGRCVERVPEQTVGAHTTEQAF